MDKPKSMSPAATQRFPDSLDGFEDIKLKMAEWPFREVDKGTGSFDRSTQLDGCARLIAAYQDIAEESQWMAFAKSHARKPPFGRILKGALKSAIRISSESGDYMLTVDFISRRAIEFVDDSWNISGAIPPAFFFQFKNLHHEHMVPGEEVCKQIVEGNKMLKLSEIRDILDDAGCRAILYSDRGTPGCERDRLDKPSSVKIGVPKSLEFRNGHVLKREHISRDLFGLFRYHHAGMIDNLVPVSERGTMLLEKYRTVVNKALLGTVFATARAS